MDLDRTSLSDGAQDLRARTPRTQERIERPEDQAPPVRPEHGGVNAPDRAGGEEQAAADRSAERRRKDALDELSRFLSIPGQTEVDIEVDTDRDQVVFKIRDRRTGEVVREVPEAESGALVQKLRDLHGALLDRSL